VTSNPYEDWEEGEKGPDTEAEVKERLNIATSIGSEKKTWVQTLGHSSVSFESLLEFSKTLCSHNFCTALLLQGHCGCSDMSSKAFLNSESCPADELPARITLVEDLVLLCNRQEIGLCTRPRKARARLREIVSDSNNSKPDLS
jgi:hypothetical protein